jgi:hypothetical protein
MHVPVAIINEHWKKAVATAAVLSWSSDVLYNFAIFQIWAVSHSQFIPLSLKLVPKWAMEYYILRFQRKTLQH